MHPITDLMAHRVNLELEIESEGDDDFDEELPEVCSSGCLNSEETRPLCLPALPCSKLARLTYFMISVISIYILYSVYLSGSSAINAAAKAPEFDLAKASNIIGSLCAEYRNGKVAGGLCSRLCTNPNYTIADLYDRGSKVVIKFQADGKDNILKMEKPFFPDFDQLDFRISEDEFTNTVIDLVNDRLMLGWPRDYKNHLIKKLWPQYNGKLTNAERASLWALLSQDEFLNLHLLYTSRTLPKVLNSCGHIYQVEYLIPFRMKGYYMNLKAKILLHLVGTLKLMDEFLNEPLQFCDVKFENLGLSGDYPKRFVIMDADMLYTESKLHHMLTSKTCVHDSECSLFDCESRCDSTTNRCTPRLNDNIDVFCKKLVNRIFGNFWSKNNRYLAACHETPANATKRLNDLRLVWSWSLAEI